MFLRSNLSKKRNFFNILRLLLLSIYQNTSECIRPRLRKKIRHERTTLNCAIVSMGYDLSADLSVVKYDTLHRFQTEEKCTSKDVQCSEDVQYKSDTLIFNTNKDVQYQQGTSSVQMRMCSSRKAFHLYK